jgi:hypothetical protein
LGKQDRLKQEIQELERSERSYNDLFLKAEEKYQSELCTLETLKKDALERANGVQMRFWTNMTNQIESLSPLKVIPFENCHSSIGPGYDNHTEHELTTFIESLISNFPEFEVSDWALDSKRVEIIRDQCTKLVEQLDSYFGKESKNDVISLKESLFIYKDSFTALCLLSQRWTAFKNSVEENTHNKEPQQRSVACKIESVCEGLLMALHDGNQTHIEKRIVDALPLLDKSFGNYKYIYTRVRVS